ncbi:hypothetical protein QL285_026962 [Trifolium repens]|nr:hypothetical protein QL285_026962 [Trifolium repens]
MENWQEPHSELKGEVSQLAAKMDRVLEMLAAQNQPSAPTVNAETATTEPASMVWPVYGLPPGYTPPGYVPLGDGATSVPPPINNSGIPAGATPTQPQPTIVQQVQEDPHDVYHSSDAQNSGSKFDGTLPQLEEAKLKFKAIEDRLKTMEGGSDSLNFSDMCLVPDLVIPAKFKVPEFEKYKGLSCPRNHLVMYSRKMASYANNDKLMIHCFQDSLAGESLSWYMQLEGNHIRSWRDLANAFIKQYQYNLDMAPSRTQLQNMTQKEGESFKVYAQRWRELASQVRPPLLEMELVDMFTNTLQGVYFERMIGSVSSGFSDLVRIGERIESGVRTGKIQASTSSPNNAKKPVNNFVRKKEGNTNAVAHRQSVMPVQYVPYAAPAQQQQQQYQMSQYAPPPQGYPYQPQPQQASPPQQQARKVFDPIPVSYKELLPYLVHSKMVTLKTLKQMTPPFPAWYKQGATCEYHSGVEGHTIETCKAFKYEVQRLIDQKLLSFKEAGPNVKGNPLPNHSGGGVNMIEGAEGLIKDVSDIRTPLSVVREVLLSFDQFSSMHADCIECEENPNNCAKMKECLQEMMDQGLVQIGYSQRKGMVAMMEPHEHEKVMKPIEIIYQRAEAKLQPLVIQTPAPFPFTNTKTTPWIYNTSASIQGKPVTLPEPVVVSIDGTGGMTRSGRVFAQKPVQDSARGPVTTVNENVLSKTLEGGAPKETTPQSDSDEFLKIIKRSDYRVVDQLGQTPSKISMLSLLMSSEAHRNALLKLLQKAHVDQDITVAQFDVVCNNITESRCLGFLDAELPAEGHAHNKALHISMKCQDNTIARVLVDTGSSLNVMPKSTLLKLSLVGPVLKPSSMIVKAFDGSQREVIGEIELPMVIGPHLFNISFQVMDINPSYSCLLGRPWIHAAGAVTSTLHQKLKFIVDDKLVIVSGEEDALVSHLSSFRYVETEEGVLETQFQALEIATVTVVDQEEEDVLAAQFRTMKIATVSQADQKSRASITYWRGLKKAMEEGTLKGWGQLVYPHEKKDLLGVGYQPSKGKQKIFDFNTPLEEVFVSAGLRSAEQINMLENEGKASQGTNNWVNQCPASTVLSNWKAVEIPKVFIISK